MSDPPVSTIIPVYNGARYLHTAIESALSQTYANHQVIVVNDGSTDDSASIIAEFGERVVYVQKKNGGIASAYNAGLSAATGELIAFLEQDDVWLPEKNAAQVALFTAEQNVGLVYCRYHIILDDDVDEPIGQSKSVFSGYCFTDLLASNLEGDTIIPFSTFMVRRSVLTDIGPFDENLRISVDYDTLLRIAKQSKFHFLDLPLALYRKHTGNTSSNSCAALEDDLVILKKYSNLGGSNRRVLYKRYAALSDALAWQYTRQARWSDLRRLRWQTALAYPNDGLSWVKAVWAVLPHGFRQYVSYYARRLPLPWP